MKERHQGTLSKQGFDVARAIGYEAFPVIERLEVVVLEGLAAPLQFDKQIDLVCSAPQ